MNTIIYNASTLKVLAAIEGKATFGNLADGLNYGTVETAPAVGDTLSAEPTDGAARTKLKANLATLITSLNSSYGGLSLSASDSYAEAATKLFAAEATYEHCNQLKLLYDSMARLL